MANTKLNITHLIIGLGDGGAESCLFKLIKFDDKNTHNVISIMGMGKYGRPLEELGIKVDCLNVTSIISAFSGLFKLVKILKQQKPDVLQTWMYHADLIGGLFGKLLGVKKIFWGIRHSDLSDQNNSVMTLKMARLCAWMSKKIPTKIISCAKVSIQEHIRYGYDKDKFIYIPNGYDTDDLLTRVTKSDIRNYLPSRFDTCSKLPISIGMVARYHPLKDHEGLLRSLKIIDNKGINFNCILVGLGLDNSNQELVSLIDHLGLEEKVHLLGQREDIPDFMASLDLHVLSSISEGFPNVIAEAMLYGTPCLSTDAGDASSIIGETGWITPTENFVAFADKFISVENEFINDLSSWQKRSKKASGRIVDLFGIKRMVEEFNTTWRS